MHMQEIVIYFVIGLIASFIRIVLIGQYLEKNPDLQKELNYYQFVRYSPIFFGIFNIVFLFIMNNYFPKVGMWYGGILAGLLISSYGRFVQKIPTKIFKMDNPNMFHVWAAVIWCLFYGLFAQTLMNIDNKQCANVLVLSM